MSIKTIKLFPLLLLISCGVRESKDPQNTQEYIYVPARDKLENTITWLNDPKSLPGGDESAPLVTTLYISQQGKTEKPAWKSNWYPSNEGGTIKVMEKYDLAIGDADKKASKWETERTNAYSNVKWAGHCNGWAAASIMTDEPKKSVMHNGVTFTPEDIKALLIESWQSSFGRVVGKRCDNQDIKYDENGKMIDEACRDVSPAAFHILLTNFLGRFKKPIIVDVEANHEVWNSPIVSYNIKQLQNLSVQDVTYWLTGKYSTTYPWNPKAVLWTYFQTEVVFSDDNKKIYEYILERGVDGNIIGGEWYRESRSNHPDFIWRPISANPENPHIDVSVVTKLYEKSL